MIIGKSQKLESTEQFAKSKSTKILLSNKNNITEKSRKINHTRSKFNIGELHRANALVYHCSTVNHSFRSAIDKKYKHYLSPTKKVIFRHTKEMAPTVNYVI